MRYQLHDIEIDCDRQQVFRNLEKLDIHGLNFRLLDFLIKKDGAIATFGELIEVVWAPAIVNEETVTQRVKLLRTALGDDVKNPRYIRSVRGRGYQLCEKPLLQLEIVHRSYVKHILLGSLATIILISAFVFYGNSTPSIESSSVHSDSGEKFSRSALGRAEYYANIGQFDDNVRAIKLYQQVLSSEPNNARALIGLSKTYSAQVCRFNAESKWADLAEKLAKDVLAINHDSPSAHAALAYSFDCRGRVEEAVAAYTSALGFDPSNETGARTSLAYLLGERGELLNALALNFREYKENPKQTFSLMQLARNYELLNYTEAAEELFAKSFTLYPDNIFSNAAYPSSLFRQGKIIAARSAVATALRRPIHPDLLVLSGELSLLAGDLTGAKEKFTKAARMRRSSSYMQSIKNIYNSDGDFELWLAQRIEAVGREINNNPKQVVLFLELTLLHQATGDTDHALLALDGAIDAGYRDSGYLHISPLFAQVRRDIAYIDIQKRIARLVDQQQALVPLNNRPEILNN